MTEKQSWWRGYFTGLVVQCAATIGLYHAARAWPQYYEGNRVLDTKVSHMRIERVLERDGRQGLNYEDAGGSYTAFFPTSTLRDGVRKAMAFDQRLYYCSRVLWSVDKDQNNEITLEEISAWNNLSKQ